MRIIKIFLKIFPLLLAVPELLLAAPSSIRIQGRLTDRNGAPIVGDDVRIRIGLYPVLSGGTLAWETPADLSVATNGAGLFATDVGPIPPMVFSGNSDLYLELRVRDTGGLKTLSPRQKIATVPYASHAQSAGAALSADTANAVIPNAIGSVHIQAESITTHHLATGSVTSLIINDGAVEVVDLSPAVRQLTIPSGMIAMFANREALPCPAGWTRFDRLDNRVAVGVESYTGDLSGSWVVNGLSAGTGGAHTHTSSPHAHGVGSLTLPLSYRGGYIGGGGTWWVKDTSNIEGRTEEVSTSIQSAGDHIHPINSDGNWRPPHLGVVYCEKD